MHNIIGQIMFTRADENFRAVDLITTIFVGHRFGLHLPKIGATMRFGQAHGAAPTTTNKFG